jgi:ABC-type glycerol-3-phosphate transport system permease component
MLDGANPLRILTSVIVPQAIPALTAVLAMALPAVIFFLAQRQVM